MVVVVVGECNCDTFLLVIVIIIKRIFLFSTAPALPDPGRLEDMVDVKYIYIYIPPEVYRYIHMKTRGRGRKFSNPHCYYNLDTLTHFHLSSYTRVCLRLA